MNVTMLVELLRSVLYPPVHIVSLWLGKMGTVVSDRRAINYAVAVVLVLFALPYSADTLGINSQTVDALVLVIQGAVILFGHLGLTKSWENRLPSGLRYKDVLQDLLTSDSPEIQALLDFLTEAGIDLEA